MITDTTFDWAFIYWMPYDNDLCVYGDEIIHMLAQGTQGSSNTLVTVQADIHGNESLSRHIISNGRISTESLLVTNSADEKVFAEFLRWNSAQFSARNWVIVLLGHGGQLDNISPDLNTGKKGHESIQWMSIYKLRGIFDQFRQEIGQQVEMLFLQNCFKGTLETHYTLRNTARFTLSSPVLVGAPNRYYEGALQYVCDNPVVDGCALAQVIMDAEKDYMYHIYTVTDNRYLDFLPNQLDPIIQAFLVSGVRDIHLDELNQFEYSGEKYVDVLEFLELIAGKSGSVEAFKAYWTDSLIRKTKYSPKNRYPELCGLTMLLPSSIAELDRYTYLPIYQDTQLSNLFQAILVE
jgi:hypothetical protein